MVGTGVERDKTDRAGGLPGMPRCILTTSQAL